MFCTFTKVIISRCANFFFHSQCHVRKEYLCALLNSDCMHCARIFLVKTHRSASACVHIIFHLLLMTVSAGNVTPVTVFAENFDPVFAETRALSRHPAAARPARRRIRADAARRLCPPAMRPAVAPDGPVAPCTARKKEKNQTRSLPRRCRALPHDPRRAQRRERRAPVPGAMRGAAGEHRAPARTPKAS
jgi:hypothetical protein